jgi:hypothetical protein
VTHTGVGRLTDVDVVVAIGEDDARFLHDLQALAAEMRSIASGGGS